MGDLHTLRDLIAKAQSVTEMTDAEHDRETKREAEEQRAARLDAFELPDDMRAAVIAGNLRSTHTLEAVRGWYAAKKSPALLLSGTTGRGKTIAALDAIANHGGAYVGAREFARLAASRWSEDVERYARLLSCAMIVIDDIGRESDAAEMSAALLDVLDARPSTRKRTVLITNFSKRELLARYPDERLRSRLHQLADFAADKGEDMRRGAR